MYAYDVGMTSTRTSASDISDDQACSDCLESLEDPEFHCTECGGHLDGLGICIECQNGA